MKILLIDPPGANQGLNTGLGYLAAALKDRHEVRVLDLNNRVPGLCGTPNPAMSPDAIRRELFQALEAAEPDMVGISVKTFTAGTSKKILEMLGGSRQSPLTLCGGPHITLEGARFLEESGADFGIQGEGERSVPELCDALEGDRSPEQVPGLLSRAKGGPAANPPAQTLPDLDGLPFPDYRSFSSVAANGGRIPEYPLLTSRGCPFHCSYCSMPAIMGRRWRSRSPARVVEELRHAKSAYGSGSFTVIDDNFTLKLERVREICNLLISQGIDLPWNSQNGIRADRITEEAARLMKRSGCRHVWIGIESADPEVFGRINKGEELKDVTQGIGQLRRAGIRVGGFFIVGLPGSTRESDLQAVDFVKAHKIDGWWFNFVPYPRTRAWDWVQAHGRILRPLDQALQYGSDGMQPAFETDTYPEADRVRTYEEIHVRLGYFDRLADPSVPAPERWRRLLRVVRPYGAGALLALGVHILASHVRRMLGRGESSVAL